MPQCSANITPLQAFAELAKAKLSTPTLRLGVLQGKRFNGAAALQHGVVDETAAAADLASVALTMARGHAPWEAWTECLHAASHAALAGMLPKSALQFSRFDAKKYSEIKMELYTDAFRALLHGVSSTAPESRL